MPEKAMRVVSRLLLLSMLATLALSCARLAGAEAEDAEEELDVEPTVMPAVRVSADRLDDFGMRVTAVRDTEHSSMFWPIRIPLVTAVLPNTAAAKAGLRPGDRILRSDNGSAGSTLFSRNRWRRIETRKWDELRSGKEQVTWVLQVQATGEKAVRTLTLVIPTPEPRWGASKWSPPSDRVPVGSLEPGPLSDTARNLHDNGVASLLRSGSGAAALGLVPENALGARGYEWTISDDDQRLHRMFVSRQRGRTDLVLEVTRPNGSATMYLTSPSGALERTISRQRRSWQSAALEQARDGFEEEVEFWLKKVGATPRWPFALIDDSNSSSAYAATGGAGQSFFRSPMSGGTIGARSEAFLKLQPASTDEKAMFLEAIGKIGADEQNWAFTETARAVGESRTTVVRVDPSKPEAQRVVLLKINGKAPTSAQVQAWRDEARDTSATIGELPPVGSFIDTSDVRIVSRAAGSILFEVPLLERNERFPPDKFQALFRVNTTSRAIEDISVRLRESIAVAGVAKVTSAGLEARFQTLDPAYPPQPVHVKGSGSVRLLLLVKISRDFETTRSDFVRVGQ